MAWTANMSLYDSLKIDSSHFPNAWNVLEVVDLHNNPSVYVAVRGEFETPEAEAVFQELLRKGRKVIGVSSYQNFPKLTCNPYQNTGYPRKTEDLFLTKYGSRVILWCHCFRDPAHFIPISIPYLLYSETDQYPHTQNLLSLNTPKTYDCFVSMPAGEWNAWIRGLPVLQRWLTYMAEEMHLKILVCGTDRRNDFSPLIDVIDFQPWSSFLKAMSSAKFLLNAAGHDASPRIILEAIGLGLPVLVNENILGGWKYVNQYTGEFFCPEEPIGQKIRDFVSKVPHFRPREWLCENFKREQNMKVLATTLNIMQSFQYKDIMQGVLVINLPNRPDRLKNIRSELSRLEVPDEMVTIISAMEVIPCGHLGCTRSHIKALEYALDHKWQRVLILEDDFSFDVARERMLFMIFEFLDTTAAWDVLMFTAGWKEYTLKTNLSFVKRLKYGTTTAGYLVNGIESMNALRDNFKTSEALLTSEVLEHVKKHPRGERLYQTANALDMYWRDFQAKHNFFITEPMIGRQNASPSSIMLPVSR